MITLVLELAVLGVLLWLIQNKLPIDDTIKLVIKVVVIVAVVIWLLHLFGVPDIHIPRIA